MGKGDNRRPMQISQEEYDRRWPLGPKSNPAPETYPKNASGVSGGTPPHPPEPNPYPEQEQPV